MTVYQLRNKINKLKTQITSCEDKIAGCRCKREQRENVLFVVQGKQGIFEGFFLEWKNGIQRTRDHLPNMSFIGKLQEDISGFMNGLEYQRALDGFGQAEWTLRNEIENLFCQENDLQYEIKEKEAELELLQRKLRVMELEQG